MYRCPKTLEVIDDNTYSRIGVFLIRRIFLTFGDGRTGWMKASRRLLRESKKTALFSENYSFTLNDISQIDSDAFRTIQKIRARQEFRGCGFWIWKPAMLFWAHLQFPNDHLLYVDAGSHFKTDPSGTNRLCQLLIEAEQNGALAWSLPNHNELQWTKSETLDLLKPSNSIVCENQVQSGYISLPPSLERNELLGQWRNFALESDGFHFTDELRGVQHPEFIEHRHDQSVLSILWKSLSLHARNDETFPTRGSTFPVVSARNNTSLSENVSDFRKQVYRYADLVIDFMTGRK